MAGILGRLAIASLFVFATCEAWACSCSRSPEASLVRATVVFSGVAQFSDPAAFDETVTTFRVAKAYRGVEPGQTIRVNHFSGDEASCGVTFNIGQHYTLMAFRDPSNVDLTTTLCSLLILQTLDGQAALRRMFPTAE